MLKKLSQCTFCLWDLPGQSSLFYICFCNQIQNFCYGYGKRNGTENMTDWIFWITTAVGVRYKVVVAGLQRRRSTCNVLLGQTRVKEILIQRWKLGPSPTESVIHNDFYLGIHRRPQSSEAAYQPAPNYLRYFLLRDCFTALIDA